MAVDTAVDTAVDMAVDMAVDVDMDVDSRRTAATKRRQQHLQHLHLQKKYEERRR